MISAWFTEQSRLPIRSQFKSVLTNIGVIWPLLIIQTSGMLKWSAPPGAYSYRNALMDFAWPLPVDGWDLLCSILSGLSGVLFTKRWDVQSYDLTKYRSCKDFFKNARIVLNGRLVSTFWRRLARWRTIGQFWIDISYFSDFVRFLR